MIDESFTVSQSSSEKNAIQISLYHSAHSGIPKFCDKLPEVSEKSKNDCQKHISGHTLLIRESAPDYYERLTDILAANKSVLMYVSPNFDIYGRFGDQELKDELKAINLRFGANMSEDLIGTNAVALSVKQSASVWTIGRQNYAQALHPYAFYAFTVKGKYNRYVHILLVTRKENLSPATVCLFRLIEATETVYSSGVLTADHWAKEGLIRTEYGSVRTENILIILGSSGQVTYVNDIFYQLFSTNYNNVINYPLPDVVPELGYVIDSIYGKGIIPSPQVVTFSAIGATEYHVTCTYAEAHSADKGFVITAQRMLSVAKSHVSAESGAKYTFDSLVGVSDNFCALKQFAERVAATNCTVLIRGESGTGKELFAHSIHNASNRWDKPFVSINCAAIPRDLIGSELFGYVGGAFTGASRTGAKGKFEQADGGTLFLDEIAEMPLDMQSVLLRVLEEGEITRIGGSKSIPVNVRLIAATNQNLEDYIHSGKFRLDLFYRLNIISLNTIPLREHKEDIDALADSFISKFSKRHNKPCDGISAEARSILHAYDWPGNTRELRNVIERGIITMSGRFIETHDLPPELMRNGTVRSMRAQEDTYSDALISDQESSRKKAVAQLMREYDGNKAKVARSLGIARSTLYRILKERE